MSLTQPEEITTDLRQWRKATGRAIISGGDILRGETSQLTRITLPIQIISVVDLRVRAAAELSIKGSTQTPHVAAALSALLSKIGVEKVEVQVLNVRNDTPTHPGSGLQAAEMVAACKAIYTALKIEADADTITESVVSVTSAENQTGLTHPGILPVYGDGTSTPWAWWPRYAVVRLLGNEKYAVTSPVAHPNATTVLEELTATVEEKSVENFASVASSAASKLTEHPLHAVASRAFHELKDKGHPVLGWVLSCDTPVAALLFAADYPGRSAASVASRSIELPEGVVTRVTTSAVEPS